METTEGSCSFHDAVVDFKRRLIEITLRQLGGNRSRTARALGLQRTYLLRLIRDLQVAAPPPPERPIGRQSVPESVRQHDPQVPSAHREGELSSWRGKGADE